MAVKDTPPPAKAVADKKEAKDAKDAAPASDIPEETPDGRSPTS